MKILNTIEELWSYCLLCPVCQDAIRNMHVSVGPDDDFILSKWKKDNNILQLDCNVLTKNRKYNVVFDVDCLSNVFQYNTSNPDSYELEPVFFANQLPYFYFYIQSDCKKCNATYVNGADLEVDFIDNKIFNINLEREGIYLLDQYHITFLYDKDEMIISRIKKDKDGMLVDEGKALNRPLIDLDLSNPTRALNKIKTLLVFS